MIDEQIIDRWVEKKYISKTNGPKAKRDLAAIKSETSSRRWIVTASVLGAALFGISALLFISANWEQMSDGAKLALILGGDVAFLLLGVYLAYVRINLPRVGESLIFLSALGFGGCLALISQIYHLDGPAHGLFGLWLLGILPLVYLFRTKALAGVASVVGMIWCILFVGQAEHSTIDGVFGSAEEVPPLVLMSSLLLLVVGGIHKRFSGFLDVARMYRLTGLSVALFCLFLFTFPGFVEEYTLGGHLWGSWGTDFWAERKILNVKMGILSALTACGLFGGFLYHKGVATREMKIEVAGVMSVLILTLGLFLFPYYSVVYPILFNLLFISILVVLLRHGQHTHDMKLVNTALFWLVIVLLARYFDLFWDMMTQSLFFLVGGVLFLGLGVVAEKQRKGLKTK